MPFLHPGLLWGTLLVAVPVLIHLLTRRRFRRLPWAAMEFLRRAHRRTQKRLRLENLLLLAVRMLVLGVLAVALARPLLTRSGVLAAVAPEGERNLALVIDNSYSMRSAFTPRPPFERALDAARKLLAGLREGRGNTAVVIPAVRTGQPAREPLFHLESVRADLEEVEASYAPADLLAALEEALGALRKVQGRREVWLFTDLQRSNLLPAAAPDRPGSDPAARLKDLGAAFRKDDAVLRVVDVGPRSADNLGIVDLRMDDRVGTTAGPLRFSATVRNHGEGPREASLEVSFDEERSRRVTTGRRAIPPGRETTFVLHHHFKERGFHSVRAELSPPDGLAVDDERRLALEVKERIRVLLVDGEPNATRFENETDFLQAALDPVEEGDEHRSPFETSQIPEHNLERTRLEAYDLIALCNIPVLGPEKAREIRERVAAGGGLFLFPGDRTDPATLHATLGEAGLLPLRLLRPQGSADPETKEVVRIAKADWAHPALRLFAEEKLRPMLLGLPFRRYFLAEPWPALSPIVPARFGDPAETPAIAELRVGDGLVLFFNTTADRAWSDLPAWPIFLPLVHEAATHVLSGAAAGRNLIVGRPIQRSFPRFPGEVTLRTPREERVRRPPFEKPGDPGRFGIFYSETGTPGLYRLSAGETGAGEELFAVNVDAGEGDLRRLTEEEWRRLAPEFPFRFEGGLGASGADPAPRAEKGEIWRSLVGGVLVLLVLEMLLAWHFGKRLA